MDKYHIGARLKGYPKDYVKSLFCAISKRMNINSDVSCVPHFTFVRPFSTEDENELIRTFDNTLEKYSVGNLGKPIIYGIEAFDIFHNKDKIIYAKLEKNDIIEGMIGDLEISLEDKVSYFGDKICLSEEDGINLHCTIVNRGVNDTYSDVLNFIHSQPFEKVRQPLMRVYLLKNDSVKSKKLILREYDFYLNGGQGVGLERLNAIDSLLFRKTQREFIEQTNYGLSFEGTVLSGLALSL